MTLKHLRDSIVIIATATGYGLTLLNNTTSDPSIPMQKVLFDGSFSVKHARVYDNSNLKSTSYFRERELINFNNLLEQSSNLGENSTLGISFSCEENEKRLLSFKKMKENCNFGAMTSREKFCFGFGFANGAFVGYKISNYLVYRYLKEPNGKVASLSEWATLVKFLIANPKNPNYK